MDRHIQIQMERQALTSVGCCPFLWPYALTLQCLASTVTAYSVFLKHYRSGGGTLAVVVGRRTITVSTSISDTL